MHWSLCVFCDLIEYTGLNSVQYQAHFLQPMGENLAHSEPDLRQAAAYGVGVAAKFGGPSYAAFVVECLPHLFNIINFPESRSEDNLIATENAISAVGKILAVYKESGAFDSASLIGAWINALPILEDSEEAPETYSLLLDLMERC